MYLYVNTLGIVIIMFNTIRVDVINILFLLWNKL